MPNKIVVKTNKQTQQKKIINIFAGRSKSRTLKDLDDVKLSIINNGDILKYD
jgi:hypothetical protein